MARPKMNGLAVEGAVIIPDDRFEYMKPEDAMALGALVMPKEIHVDHIKRKWRNIAYGPEEGQLLDIYLPEEGDGPFPTVLYVHGGGWVLGTRDSSAIDLAIDGVNRGYAVVGIDYRLVPTVAFPEYIWDVKTAVRFLRAHAAEYKLDPERFGMMGDSAGGHITLMNAVTQNHPEYEGPFGFEGESTKLSCCVSLYGVSCFDPDKEDEWFLESKVPRMGMKAKPSLYDVMFGEDIQNLINLVSPINMVNTDMPPVLFLHGLADPLVAYQNSKEMYEKMLKICGEGSAEMELFEGLTHADPAFLTKPFQDKIFAFFDKHLK